MIHQRYHLPGEFISKIFKRHDSVVNQTLRKLKSEVASREYIERLQMTVEHLHGCSARHVSSKHVHEVFRGETAWKGDVEVFELTGHPKAKRCYGWSYGDPEQFITILELPPVVSPETAVKVGVAYQIKKRKI